RPRTGSQRRCASNARPYFPGERGRTVLPVAGSSWSSSYPAGGNPPEQFAVRGRGPSPPRGVTTLPRGRPVRPFWERSFRLREHATTVRSEVLGGVTTFLTMAYIIVVNPAILENAGIPKGPGTVATVLAAVFGCLLMGLYANRPIAVAPYMGENAFIA